MAWKPESGKLEQREVLLPDVLKQLADSMNGGAEVIKHRWFPILRNEFSLANLTFDITVGASELFSIRAGGEPAQFAPGTAHVVGELKPGQTLSVLLHLAPGETQEQGPKGMVIWNLTRSVEPQGSDDVSAASAKQQESYQERLNKKEQPPGESRSWRAGKEPVLDGLTRR